MKSASKALALFLSILMLTPILSVSAETSRTEELVDKLNASEMMQSLGGTATYDDGCLSIGYTVQEAAYDYFYYTFGGSVITYSSGEINDYDEAVHALSQMIYGLQLIYAALEKNGYTEEEIGAFFANDASDPTMEVNGFAIEQSGEGQEFTSTDGTASLTLSPISITLDVSKANLNGAEDDLFVPTETTVEDVVALLAADESFTAYVWDDVLYYENTITVEDNEIAIEHIDYTYDDHFSSFECEDDVLTYEVGEIYDADQASAILEDEMWAIILLQYALEANGYTEDEILAAFSMEENPFNYERNGILIEENGDAMTFPGDYGDELMITPVTLKFDFAKANLEFDEPVETDEPEVSPVPTDAPVPKSGDTTNVTVAFVLFSIAAGCCAVIVKSRKNAEE